MKKRILTFMIAALFTVSGFAVQAKAEGETSTTTSGITYKAEAGITPDSMFYPIDKLIDQLQVIVSFTDGSKVEAILSNSQERLGESELMAEAGKQEAAQKALVAYTEAVAEANDKLDEIIEAFQDSEDGEKDEKIAKLEEAVAEEQKSSTEILEGMTDEVSGDYEEVLDRVIEMQTAKKAAVRAMVDARHELNASRKEYNATKVQLKKVEKSGDEELIKKAQEALKVAEEALRIESVEYKTAFETKQETVKKYSGNKVVTTEDEKSVVEEQNATTEDTALISVQAPEETTQETADKETSTETKNASDKNKEDKKSAALEKGESKKDEKGKGNSEAKDKSENATNLQNSGKGSNKK
jgi:hypothetical protein